MSRQKFKMFTFVHVCKDMPSCMGHFASDFDAIVGVTYAQLHHSDFNGTGFKQYKLYKVENGKIVGVTAWYDESQLTALPEQDRDKAEQLVEDYLAGRGF